MKENKKNIVIKENNKKTLKRKVVESLDTKTVLLNINECGGGFKG